MYLRDMSDCALPTQDLDVTSSSSVAGGTLNYSFVARGAKVDTGTVRTRIRIAGVPDPTVLESQVVVTKKP